MNADETRRAAQVMLDSLKPGSVAESRSRHGNEWGITRNPMWDWEAFDYRISEPKHTKIADLPPVCWIRHVGMKSVTILRSVDESEDMIMFGTDWRKIISLQNTHEYSADRINWTPFV